MSGYDCSAGGANSRVAASSLYGGTDYGINTTYPFDSGYATLTLPASGNVTIIIAFAAFLGSVRITPTFFLTAQSDSTKNASYPSFNPTEIPNTKIPIPTSSVSSNPMANTVTSHPTDVLSGINNIDV